MSTNIPFVFFGTPDFSVIILEELFRVGLVPTLVVTAPDAARGRGMEVLPSPVRVWAQKRGISTITPSSLKDTETQNALSATHADVFVIAAYGYILPKHILDIPPRGVLNIHPSLLPQYRGATPIQGALLAGETHTGVTVMLTDTDMDHGPIIAQRGVPITPVDDAATLTDALAHLGGTLAAEVLLKWVRGEITATPQEHTKATFTAPLTKSDGRIDWNTTIAQFLRTLRAYHTWPTFWCEIPSKKGTVRVRILSAHAVSAGASRPAGTLISYQNKPCVALADGWILLDTIRIAGKNDADSAALWSITTPDTMLL
ncbi:MAG: methionyl-tRNA formyltransferase [Patescibacteria group bacterium]